MVVIAVVVVCQGRMLLAKGRSSNEKGYQIDDNRNGKDNRPS